MAARGTIGTGPVPGRSSGTGRRAARRRPAAAPHGERTRAALIEVAGRTFASKGFHAATGQEICRGAGVHPAAIVYHFHGMRGLYRAVLDEAQRRLVTTDALGAAVAGERDPVRKLQAFLGTIVRALTSPASRTWAGRLFGREFVTPSSAYGRAHDRTLAARAAILKSVVGAVTGLRPQDPAVARACLSIMAPCAVLLLFDRRKLQRLLPQLRLEVDDAAVITRELSDFAMAGLTALARRRKRDGRWS